jgi:spore coat protein U domain-containing protein, fimbrial subunit CupE1/2/3/6
MKRTAIISLVAALALCPGEARAISMCTIVSVVGVGFGTYDTLSSSTLDSMGSVTYNCQNVGPSDQITIDLSKGTAATFSPRRIYSGANTLTFNLYLSAARTSIWGDGTAGTSRYGPVQPPNGTNTTVYVYGRIPGSQNVPAGSYTDTIVVTINF